LLFEDDNSIRSALTIVLENADYQVITASNGIEALEKLQAYEFLNKPVEVKDLLYIVDNFFDLSNRTTFA
jgi:DNA-binding NtrC family response regulator